jgi:hypothetical protein
MSKDGPASGGICYDPWYKARSVNEVNAFLRAQKLVRRAGELSKGLRAEGLTTDEIFDEPEIKNLIAQLSGLSRFSRGLAARCDQSELEFPQTDFISINDNRQAVRAAGDERSVPTTAKCGRWAYDLVIFLNSSSSRQESKMRRYRSSIPRRASMGKAEKFAASITRDLFGRFYWDEALARELVDAMIKDPTKRRNALRR